MANKVVELVGDCPDGVFVDATLGSGGHFKAVIDAYGDRFRYFGFDLDSEILGQTRKEVAAYNPDAVLINSNFAQIAKFLQGRGISEISAALFDLGIGSFQIDDPSRGFSYLQDGPLSMSFQSRDQEAAAIIGDMSEQDLTALFYKYGEEPKAKLLARAIKNYPGPLTTTGQLAGIIKSAVGERAFIKSAARIFQALRIEVNREFDNITEGLETVLPLIAPGGRAMIITYHSLEDHLVKRLLKKYSGKCICPPKLPECRCGKVKMFRPVTSKPILADAKEIKNNSRARSAKMRVVERIAIAS